MAYISFFTTLMLVTAQVLSHIGLGEAVFSGELLNVTFVYARDHSVFGDATISREAYALSRVCAAGTKPCPGVSPDSRLDLGYSTGFPTTIPDNITQCFSSGTAAAGDLRSSPFEVQFRQFTVGPTSQYKNVTGIYNYIGQVVLEPGYHLKEGVVIDATDGGLGFRNHTVPSNLQLTEGATRYEDLLWIDPVTTCLETNWTHYAYPQLNLFAQYDQALAQGDNWLEYEDHAVKYQHAAPRPHGLYRFDERLRNASEIFTQKLRKAYNVSSYQMHIVTKDAGWLTDLRVLLDFEEKENAGYVFRMPDDADSLSGPEMIHDQSFTPNTTDTTPAPVLGSVEQEVMCERKCTDKRLEEESRCLNNFWNVMKTCITTECNITLAEWKKPTHRPEPDTQDTNFLKFPSE